MRRPSMLTGFGRGLLLLALAAGCALKDPPTEDEIAAQGLPGVVVPDAWLARGAGEPVQGGWLDTFGDPRLEELVSEALARNTDLQSAAARLEQAAAALEAAGSQLVPAVDLLGRAGGKNSGDNSGLKGAWLNATWELDLWGRIRYGVRAAEEQYFSSEADYVFTQQSIAAMVAKAWFLATETFIQRSLAREMAGDAENFVSIMEERFAVGPGNEIDVSLARVNLLSFRDAEQEVELAHRGALRALEVLIGRYPGAIIEPAESLPELSPTPPAGVPSELLERRPDVIAARHRVAAAFARVEEARTLRLPALSLTGGLSHISSDLFVLEERDDIVASGGARLYLPIFQGGEIQAQIEARTAEQNDAVARWASTGLRAFEEVESALSNEVILGEREPLLAARVRESERALDLEQVRYRVGVVDLRAVLQQAIATYSARTQLLRVQSERRMQRVNLYLALGGGLDDGSRAVAASSSP